MAQDMSVIVSEGRIRDSHVRCKSSPTQILRRAGSEMTAISNGQQQARKESLQAYTV